MDTTKFDKDKDKLTEAETVYDFFERLTLGKILTIDDDDQNAIEVFGKNTSVKTVLEQLVYGLPGSLRWCTDKYKSFTLEMSTGDTFINKIIYGEYETKDVIAAISTSTGQDLKDEILLKPQDDDPGYSLIVYSTPYAYKNDDIITVYLKVK